MSLEQQIYRLSIQQFLSRFRNSKKIDDIFSRGYTLCTDTLTGHRSILKFYSIQTTDQEQAVLQNLINFAKLNQIQGICKLVAYATAESGTELISAFQYDPMTLGQFVKVVKDINVGKSDRQLMYIEVMRQLLKIIATGLQIGIQLDDINRQTVIIRQSPLLHPHNQPPNSSSSIQPMPLNHYVNIFYDERQKQYNRLQSTSLSLSPPSSSSLSPSSNSLSFSNNKIYWSAQKLQNQVVKGREYSSQDGEESIYQLGLMMMDIAYQIQKFYSSGSSGSIQPEQLRPDEIAVHTQNVLSYYQIDKIFKKVDRNQVLVSHRLNYLINSSDQLNKQLGILFKGMIQLYSQSRADINKVDNQLYRLLDLHKYRSVSKPETPMRGLQKNTQSLRSIQSNQEEAINFPSSDTLKIISSVPKFPSTDNIDSLKYSQNSIGNPNQNIFDTFKLTNSSNTNAPVQNSFTSPSQLNRNSSPSPVSYKKQGANHPQSSTTITSSNANNKFMGGFSGYEGQRIGEGSPKLQTGFMKSNGQESIQRGSIDFSGNLKAQDIVAFWKGDHDGLKTLLTRAVDQLEQIKKVNPRLVLKKQYVDKSLYYGCIDSSSKRQGLGIYIYKTGDIYFGTWKDNNLANGTYLFKNGQSFEGVVKNGKQGHGVYRYSNGNIYDGQWQDDLKNGRGIMTYPNGAKYEGNWMKGKKHGEGTYFYENGIQYKGGFALGRKSGNGVFLFPGGTKVQGFWDNNHLEGQARIYYRNGDYYEGNLHLSEKSGEGTYRWNNNEEGQVEYKGEFSKDNLDGFAVIRFKNGQSYQGRVRNGKRDGQGNYRYSNGDQFKGEWKNDDKKIGKYIFSTGDIFEGTFKDGQMAFGVMKYQNGEIYQGDFYRGERHGVGTYSNKVGHLVYQGRWQRDQYLGPNRH